MGLRWAVAPLGFWQLRLLGTGAGPVALTRPWQESGALDSAAALLSRFSFPGPEWQLTQATVDGPDGLRYKGYGDGVYQTIPAMWPMLKMVYRMVSNGEPMGAIT